MRDIFPEFYRPTKEEFDELWSQCIFAFDANILLNLYRYSERTQQSLLKAMKGLRERIWVPHQAALEFQERRLDVIFQQLKTYDLVKDCLEETLGTLEKKLNEYRRHHLINVDDLIKDIRTVIEKVEKDLERMRFEHPNLADSDPLLEEVGVILQGRVGQPYTEDENGKLFKEGDERFQKGIPPGYKDKNKEGNRKYGDFIIWRQLIDRAKATIKPLIFVTDDGKEDWWLKHNGKTIGPRRELRREFLTETNAAFYMYNAESFLQYAEEYLRLPDQSKAIAEVREVRECDEKAENQELLLELLSELEAIPDLSQSSASQQQYLDAFKELQSHGQMVGVSSENLWPLMVQAKLKASPQIIDAMNQLKHSPLSQEMLKAQERFKELYRPIQVHLDTLRNMKIDPNLLEAIENIKRVKLSPQVQQMLEIQRKLSSNARLQEAVRKTDLEKPAVKESEETKDKSIKEDPDEDS